MPLRGKRLPELSVVSGLEVPNESSLGEVHGLLPCCEVRVKPSQRPRVVLRVFVLIDRALAGRVEATVDGQVIDASKDEPDLAVWRDVSQDALKRRVARESV